MLFSSEENVETQKCVINKHSYTEREQNPQKQKKSAAESF